MARGKPPASRKKPQPTGKLAEPIKIALATPTIASGALDPAVREAAEKSNTAERERGFVEAINRLELLFPHYGLTRTGNDGVDFRILSLALAMELFLGFHVENSSETKPYRHKRDNPQTLVLLLADIETIKRERGGTISDLEAIRILRTDLRFAGEWGQLTRQDSTLQNWLVEARNPAINVYWPAWQAGAVQKLALTGWVNILVRGRLYPDGPKIQPSRKSPQQNS